MASERFKEATPRPWNVYIDHPGYRDAHAGPVICADGQSEASLFVAECAWDATRTNDAELIVHAVNLYDALEAVAEAASIVGLDKYGEINARNFYRLREALEELVFARASLTERKDA